MRSEPLPDEIRGLAWTHKMTSLAESYWPRRGACAERRARVIHEGGRTMISKTLSRRLERLEEQLVPIIEEPLIIVVKYVTTDGEVSEAYRVTVPNTPPSFWRWQQP